MKANVYIEKEDKILTYNSVEKFLKQISDVMDVESHDPLCQIETQIEFRGIDNNIAYFNLTY